MTSLLKNIFQLFIFLITLVSLVSCKSEHPNPEQLDPIYKDLNSELNNYKLQIKSAKEQVDKLQAEYEGAEVRSLDKRVAEKDLQAAKDHLKQLLQQEHYYKIRAERRRVEGRRAYRLAFEKGEEWPDPKEYEAYKANKKLREAPREWGSRVPKLFKGNPNYQGEEQK